MADLLPLDFVLTLTDLRKQGVDFTERVPLHLGDRRAEQEISAETARLRLAAKAVALRPATGEEFDHDPEDVRKFVQQVLSIAHAFEAQSVVNGTLGLTFVTTLQRSAEAADRG